MAAKIPKEPTEQISVRLPQWQVKALRDLARTNRRRLGETLEQILRDYFLRYPAQS